MKAQVILTIFLMLVITGNVLAGRTAGITLKDKVYVDEGKVFLGQIARIETRDKSLSKKIGSIYIARTPPPGHYVRLSKKMLKVKIQNAGLSNDEFRLNMSPTVRVYSRETLKLEKKKNEEKEKKTAKKTVKTTARANVKQTEKNKRGSHTRQNTQNRTQHSKRKDEVKIRRGDPLKIYFVKKNLVIKMTGTAAEAGIPGKRIRVYLNNKRKIFRAVLQDESTAVIEL